MTPVNADVNGAIAGFESVLRRAVPLTIEFDIDLGQEVGIVSIDSQRFEAALLNLVVNSRDAMPAGGVLLLHTGAVDLAEGGVGVLPAGRYARIKVVDSGEGMTHDLAASAVESFYSTTGVGRGTGRSWKATRIGRHATRASSGCWWSSMNRNCSQPPRWANEHHPGLKLVLTSGYPRPAQAEQHGGMDRYAFVNKPYRLTELAKVLRSV